jgi:sugar phosphate isomerase/epimerase
MKIQKIGAQLYTIREFTQTQDDLARSLEKITKIGYSAIQISAIGKIDPEVVHRLTLQTNLTIASTHMAWEQFRHNLDELIDIHKLWKCSHPAIGGLPTGYFRKDGWRQFINELEPVVEKLNQAGMDFSYHNHNHELVRYGDKTWLAHLYDTASPELLKAEIDTYWIQAGGGDPAWWIERCAGREPLLHLKDMSVAPQHEIQMAEIGEGNLNWQSILNAAKNGGVEWYLVEQDSCYDRDPFESLAISYHFLSQMGLE